MSRICESSGFGQSIDEIATEYAIGLRCPEPHPDFLWAQQQRLNEMLQRTGIERTDQAIDRALDVLDMVGI
jgi:hypothetical protein